MRGRWQIEAEIRHFISASLTGKNCPCIRDLHGARRPFSTLAANLEIAAALTWRWQSLRNDTSRPFPKPGTGRIAVKVINHLGDEVIKVFPV